MFDRLELMEKTYNEINDMLASGITDLKKIMELSKEAKKLERVVLRYLNYKAIVKEVISLKEIIKEEKDLELIEMAQEEKHALENKADLLLDELKVLLLPKDPNDEKNVIVEIRGAAGGDEANIFAGDLFRMYSKYCDQKGWKLEVLSSSAGSMGGFTQIEFMINGDQVYSQLKYESGVHRVQRVPETENMGRVHTSTTAVLVLPEADEIDFDLKWEDIKVDTMTSSGPGGQSVNTTQSAVRLTYIPTGLAVYSQVAKSQYENKDMAYKLLKARLYDEKVREAEEKDAAARHSVIKRADRAEKIRTYNYPQNRVTDHRIGLNLQSLNYIMDGKLDLVIEPLINEMQKRALIGENNNDN
ncbi:MAG: peptide chain release factor 1 [Acholeplasmatales bacterium]|jgi:peptide chain release factor 1|nr:peptide chain release factor 1 [Acholeplasmatales bacterium]